MKLFNIYYILLLTLALSSCITSYHTNYLQTNTTKGSTFKDSINYDDYRIKEGDHLFVHVYALDIKTAQLFNGSNNLGIQIATGNSTSNASELYTYTIQPDGNINFPLVGNIMLMGKSIRESKTIIQNAIAPILKLNSIDVRLVGRTFSIIGAGKAGKYNIPKEKINILQAIAIAGDLGLYADRSKVKLMRQTVDGPVFINMDIRNTNIINSKYYYIEPDDVIFLEPVNAQFFRVNSLWTGLSTILTSISFATGIYGIITKY